MSQSSNRTLKTVIFDSNIWISSFVISDVNHYESKRLIARYLAKRYLLIIPVTVIIEIFCVLLRKKISSTDIHKFIVKITKPEISKVLQIEVEKLLDISKNILPTVLLKSLDFIIYIHYIHYKVNKLETFDKNLQNHICIYEKEIRN